MCIFWHIYLHILPVSSDDGPRPTGPGVGLSLSIEELLTTLPALLVTGWIYGNPIQMLKYDALSCSHLHAVDKQ